MPSEEDLRNADSHNSDLSDKISKEGQSKLRELKANLDKHIKGVKDEELGELDDNELSGELVFDKEKFVEKMKKNKEENEPKYYSTLRPTPEQEVENRLKKEIEELKERINKLEQFVIAQLTNGGSQQ